MKVLYALPLALLLGAASSPPADVQTGRSVAVEKPQKYWLSDDLSRLFLQKSASGAAVQIEKPAR